MNNRNRVILASSIGLIAGLVALLVVAPAPSKKPAELVLPDAQSVSVAPNPAQTMRKSAPAAVESAQASVEVQKDVPTPTDDETEELLNTIDEILTTQVLTDEDRLALEEMQTLVADATR